MKAKGLAVILFGLSLSGITSSAELVLKSNPLVVPSFRQQKLEVFLQIENKSQQPVVLTVQPLITDFKTNQPVPGLTPVSLTVAAGYNGEISFSLPASNLKPWSHWDPQLYYLDLLLKPGGSPELKAERVRFGYREVWTEKGNIYVNGKKVFLLGGNHAGRRNETEMKFAKLAGFNADTIPDDLSSRVNQTVLDLADRYGHYLVWSWAPVNADSRGWLYAHGNHPSLIGYAISSPEPVYMLGPHGHPMGIGAVIPEQDKDKPPIQLIRRLNQIDPGRIYGYYVVGLGGNFRSLMWDLGWGVPVQSQEEWLSYWSKNREKVEPFFPQEFALVRLGANMVRMDRKFGGSAIVEQMARYAGEEAYRRFDPETMAESYAPDAKQVWTKRGFQNEPNSTFFYMVKDYLYTRVFPAWRVAGFAGALLHVDGHPQNLVLDGQVSPLAKTLAKISAELYFFLGGPENDYVCKGHIFYAGETINKSAILVNDSPGDVTVAVSWWLQDEKGKTFCFRTEKLSVPQGKTGFLPITFQAPEVKEKTELKLMASWKEPTGQEHQAEPLLLRVYPRENFVWREGEIAVVDATGATLKILQEMKIPAVSLTRDKAEQNLSLLKRVRLLVVGRQSYPLAVQIINPEAMMSALREGLNVVVLEQLNRYVCGLKLENTGSREVFIRAKDSPLFAGLDNHDFSNWRGESTLLPAYPSFDSESLWWYASYSYQGQMNAWRQRRAWHWSNKGTVATFCFEKPQQGNFRVLADAGFDLLYAAAVEFSVGRGRLLLSQLDLTDRYGKDPVATRWFQRLLSEYTSLKSGVRTPVGVLSEPSLKVMEDFGLETSEGLNTAVAYLSADDLKKLSHQQVNSVKQFVTAGGSLLTYFETPEQAAKLPVKLKYEPRKIFNPDLPEHPVFSGLGRSEVFLREPHQMQAITGAEDTRVVSSSSGLAAVCQAGKGLVVILQVPPDKGKSTPEGWSRPKVRRLYATVLSNLGASSRIIPDWAAIGGWGQVEEWLPGYAERVPKKAPRVKESPFYPEPGLDWDPDAHVAF